jgi:hypothetical protein
MTQIGESISVPISVEDPEKSITAEVLELEFVDYFKASIAQVVINPPHWPATRSPSNQSSKAVVFKLNNPGTQKAKIKIKVTSKGYSGNGKLTGLLQQFEFEGNIPLSSGEHIVEVTLKEPPDSLLWCKGEIFWGIEATDRSLLAGRTHVEIFFVFADPSHQLCFARDGVWVEALRFLFDNSSVSGVQAMPGAVEKVTQCCFGLPNHKYEVEEGRAKYGGASGIFKLKDYIDFSLGFVNCYDQTYAVIVLSAALGISVEGLYMNPFGYIRPVHLVGWGLCNNPFPGLRYVRTHLIVDVRDQDRTSFGNHMFCEYSTKIYDACAGPVKGNTDRAGYISSTIDTVMPPNARANMPGTLANITTIIAKGWHVRGVQ